MTPATALPVYFGVTGHRDLPAADVPTLEASVRGIFERFRARHPHTPIVLLTPLASGADRLVARVAVSLGVPIRVPLPLEETEYRKDFDPSDDAELDVLMAGAEASYVMPFAPGNDASNVSDGARRALQYQLAGEHVSSNTQLMLALWNGKPTPGVGGTAQIADFRLTSGAIYHVLTARVSDPEVHGEVGSLAVRTAAGIVDEEHDPASAVYAAMEDFNRDRVTLPTRTGTGTQAGMISAGHVALTIGLRGGGAITPAAEPQVREQFEAELRALAESRPFTPLILLTTLATRGEILAVETAADAGIPVFACLATAPDDIAASMIDRELRGRFILALARCTRVQQIPASSSRIVRLLLAEKYVLTYSHLTVILGDDEVHVSGVASEDTIGAELEETRLGTAPEVGPIYRIAVTSGDEPDAVTASTTKDFPLRFTGDTDKSFEADFESALKSVDAFNAELAKSNDTGSGATIDAVRDRIAAIAGRLQKITFTYLTYLYLAAVAATAVQYSLVPALMYGAVAIGFVLYRVARHFDYENRYQDYRALSEALRVQRAWLDAGIVADRPDQCYLAMQQRELLWIRMALRYYHLAHRDGVRGSVDAPGCTSWVADQWRYFQQRPAQLREAIDRLKRRRMTGFWAGLATSAILLGYLYVPTAPETIAGWLDGFAKSNPVWPFTPETLAGYAGHLRAVQSGWNGSWLFTSDWMRAIHTWDLGSTPDQNSANHQLLLKLSTAFIALYTAIALLMANYIEKKGFSVNIKRYQRMFFVFDRAKRELESIGYPDNEAGRTVLRELGHAALIENADWLLSQRERPISIVLSG